jgi:hypothetical protein
LCAAEAAVITTIVASVIVGALAAAFTAWALFLFAKASTSAESKVRRGVRFLEILMFSLLSGFYVLTAQSGKERKPVLLVIGLWVGVWLFRGARVLMARRNA